MSLPKRLFISVALSLATLNATSAAPLFPDIPDNHWGRDAVAALSAKGLVEGYPGGTFKGDRAASRWEVAMEVARLLQKMESQHATFASKAELEAVRKLALAFREELDALGVRVTNLEEETDRIDQRVSELERISFYGSFETRLINQSFSNTGVGLNGGNLRGTPGPPQLNYDQTVGADAGAPLRPQVHGVFPTVSFEKGKALTSGTALTSRADLGVNIDVSEDLDAGLELSAFSTQGDVNVGGFWGITPPFLTNPVTANRSAGGAQPLNHQPFTRMVFNKFWLKHKPSQTRLQVGEIIGTNFDGLIFAGPANLGVYGTRRWAGFGFDVTGEVKLGGEDRLEWEALGTRYGNGARYLGTNYQNYAVGGNLAYVFDKDAGNIKAQFVRIAEEAAPGGGPFLVGGFGTGFLNVPYGASNGWNLHQWVNPPGFFAGQQTPQHQAATGQAAGGFFQPNTVDIRPIPGWSGTVDNAAAFGVNGGGNYGPQATSTYGITGEYRWELSDTASLQAFGKYARSDYKSNRNSPFTAEGDAFEMGVNGILFDGDLDLTLRYLSVDPTYNPQSYPGNLLGARIVRAHNYTGNFFLHDFGGYPHNREGFAAKFKWKFNEGKGSVFGGLKALRQKETSLYDVRVTPNALGLGVPNFPVIGFSPGFFDNVFFGFAHPNQYGTGTANSFTPDLQPLENPRGSQDFYKIGASYRWDDPAIEIRGLFERQEFLRRSSLTPQLGGSQNHVDLFSDYFHLNVAWEPKPDWELFGGLDYIRAGGHLDPAGLYNSYAIATGSNSFRNLDSEQWAPYVGFSHDLTEKTRFSFTATRYETNDQIDSSVRAGSALDTFGATAHPFSWDGWQLESHFIMKF